MKTVLIVVAVTVATAILMRAGRRPAGFEGDSDAHCLRYSPLFRSLGWLGVAAAVAVLGLATVWRPQDQGDWIAVIGMVVGFAGLGAVLVNEGRTRIRLSSTGIHAFSPWRGEIEIPWGAVREVHYSKLSQWFIIRGESRSVIRVHNFMSGISTLLEYFHKQLKPELFAKAENEYRALMGGAL